MGKRLVAYFSAGGTTKKVAEMIANSAKADLFEIEPKIPYTKADLDWMDQKSRSSMEMNDKKFRPEVLDTDTDFNAYDEIILGFPIWWYVAPTIVNTFLEKHDFSDKKINFVCYFRWKRIWKHHKRIKTLCTKKYNERRKDT